MQVRLDDSIRANDLKHKFNDFSQETTERRETLGNRSAQARKPFQFPCESVILA